jgi:hypothetical protein
VVAYQVVETLVKIMTMEALKNYHEQVMMIMVAQQHASFTQQKQVKKKETLGCMILKIKL